MNFGYLILSICFAILCVAAIPFAYIQWNKPECKYSGPDCVRVMGIIALFVTVAVLFMICMGFLAAFVNS
jgi:hypothetical protein